jgi:hypothetical protein
MFAIFLYAQSSYITGRGCNKCACSLSTGSRMFSGVTHIVVYSSLTYHCDISVGGFTQDSGRVRMNFSPCVVPLLSSRFAASAVLRFSNFLQYLAVHLFISLSAVFTCRPPWILRLFPYQGAFSVLQTLGLQALKDFGLSPTDECH